nr:DNA repair protein RadA [Hyphomicrobium zavarzinii]
MAKAAKSSFVCQSCGAISARWAGKCGSCGDWNTIVEEMASPPPPGTGLAKASKGRVLTLETLTGAPQEAPRLLTGMPELDRVT